MRGYLAGFCVAKFEIFLQRESTLQKVGIERVEYGWKTFPSLPGVSKDGVLNSLTPLRSQGVLR